MNIHRVYKVISSNLPVKSNLTRLHISEFSIIIEQAPKQILKGVGRDFFSWWLRFSLFILLTILLFFLGNECTFVKYSNLLPYFTLSIFLFDSQNVKFKFINSQQFLNSDELWTAMIFVDNCSINSEEKSSHKTCSSSNW